MDDFGIHPVTQDVRWEAVRHSIGELTTIGVDPWHVLSHASGLVDLEVVRRSAGDEANQYELAIALMEMISEFVQQLQDHPHGRLLRVLLPFDPEFTDADGITYDLPELSARERRTLGGSSFQGPRNVVGPDAVRLNHERTAYDRLTVMILRDEVAETEFWPVNDGDAPTHPLLYLPREIVPVTGQYGACDQAGGPLGRQNSCEVGRRFPAVRENAGEYGWALFGKTTARVKAGS
jgi:hypothetical protein